MAHHESATYREVAPRRTALVRRLSRLFGRSRVLSSAIELEAYAYDASMERGRPDAVVLPASTAEVAALYRLCSELGVPVVPRGSGTNLSGGSTAPLGGVVCQLSRMNRILALEPEERRAVVQPFVYTDELNSVASRHGLHFAPDPSSLKTSTLGGNAAENSGGPHALKYGVVSHHVLGVELVTPSGDVVRIGGRGLDRSGADLLSLIVGSEGTLGTITELTVRLTPNPENVVTLLAVFDDEDRAGQAVTAVIASGIVPATLEMMDRETIRAVEMSSPAGYPPDAEAVLLIEIDGLTEATLSEAETAKRICLDLGARSVEATTEPLERDRLWHGRRHAYAALARVATGMMVCDGVVPRDVLPEALRRIRAIVTRYGIRMADTFHAGDGNVHPKLLFDARAPGAFEKVVAASAEIMWACVDLGGAITGEHGVGTEKIAAMPWSLDAATLRLNRATKRVFDSREVANPGKVLRAEDVPPMPEALPAGPDLAADLAAVARCTVSPADEADAIDCIRPAWCVRPTDTEALAAALGVCAAHRAAVAVVGGGTALEWGPPLEALDVLIRTERMTRVVELRPQNLSASFEAGVTLESAWAVLRGERLALRFDPPLAAAATMGGVASVCASGPSRLAFGPTRDAVLGVAAALTTGEVAATGGRTMKNVTGYDLARFLVGSRGALAAIGHVTVRLLPAPQAERLVCCGFGSLADAVEAGSAVVRCVREPRAVRATLESGRAMLWVSFAGVGRAVERLVRDCSVVLGAGAAEVTPVPLPDPVAQASLPAVEITVPPSREGAVLGSLGGAAAAAAAVDVGSGYMALAWPAVSREVLEAVAAAAAEHRGWVLDVRGSVDLRKAYYAARSSSQLLLGLKCAFDPRGVLSPGRLS